MIILNITFASETALVDELTAFIKDILIPAAENDGLHSFILSRVKPHGADEDEGTVSLALQMRSPGEKQLSEFYEITAQALLEYITKRWGSRVLFFITRLDVLHDSNRK